MSEYNIKIITDLLEELKDNYHEILLKLDEEDNLETILYDDYKKIIDTIRGIQEYTDLMKIKKNRKRT